ncbi:hypothetical protein LCGC14_1279430 [marine sediment metagenome]|uniref:Uncharacterized protein n=1 Tax=marine sediment metagenome TaxID=412755 RepID=A0A0F9NYS5_9ZZZZ
MTKGIILSGGWGTRLRPLTCTIPKTLIPIVNKPVIERQLLLLKSAGIKEVVLAVSVMGDVIKNYFKDGKKLGLKIHYTDERFPLGTAGAIKLAEDLLKGEDFFMLNGDVILNFDFKEMIKAHKKYGGIGLIASKLVSDPSRYGVLIVDDDSNKILKFLEKSEFKPLEGKSILTPINAGVYLLEPEIFQYIEPEIKFSIEREVFPILTSEERLYYHPISGIWKDIGKPEELLEGNILLMNDILRNLEVQKENLIFDNLDVEGKVIINPPVTIGENVVIRKNCQIGPNAIIGDNVYIDVNAEIKDAVIYNEVYISKNVKLEKVIISDNCLIHDGAKLIGNNQNLVLLSSHVEVLEDVNLIAPTNNSISICHHEVVKEYLFKK